MKLLPVAQVGQTAKAYTIPAYKDFPNSSLHKLPLIIYRPFADTDGDGKTLKPDQVEELLTRNSLTPAWRYGMFPFDHYHSNTHEVLVSYQGTAELAFGHHQSPDAVKHHARAGDVYVLPAGITHRSLSQSSDFQMVGSYPGGSSDWDNCKGGNDDRKKEKQWKMVEKLGLRENWLEKDPVYGDSEMSPLREFWQ